MLEQQKILYGKEDYKLSRNVLVVKYRRFLYNRYEFGFEKGILPLLEYCLKNSVDTILFDLEETDYVEAETFGAVLNHKQQIEHMGIKHLRLINPSTTTMVNYNVCGFDYEFGEPYCSLEDAVLDLTGKGELVKAA